MRIGLAQLAIHPEPDQVSQNREHSNSAIRRLFEEGAELVVLPELTHWGYFPRSCAVVEQMAERIPEGESVQQWMALARRYRGFIVGGILENSAQGFHNTAVLIGPNGVLACYRKVHLFDWETQWLTAGNQWTTVWIDGVSATVGLLICYDLRFPEAVRQLALMGADLIVVPTTWTSVGKPQLWDSQGYCLQNHVAIAHAYCQRVAMVCADRVGNERGVTYLGASVAVAPSGMVAAGPLSGREPTLAVVDIDLVSARDKTVGSYNHLLNDRRPALYHRIIETPRI